MPNPVSLNPKPPTPPMLSFPNFLSSRSWWWIVDVRSQLCTQNGNRFSAAAAASAEDEGREEEGKQRRRRRRGGCKP